MACKLSRALYILILGMLTAFGPVCTDLYLPALPQVSSDLLSEPSTIQLSLASCFLGLACGQIIIGPLSDALGRRLPLLISLILFTLASMACAMAQNVWFLIAVRFLQGASGAGGVVLARAMACDMFKGASLTRFMAMLMTVNSIAPILGPIAGSLILHFGTWHLTFWCISVWGVLLLVLCTWRIDETLDEQQRQSRLSEVVSDMFRELLNRRFLLLTLSMAFINGGFFAYLAASPFVFQTIYGFSAAGFSIIFAVNAAAITVMAQVSGRLSKIVPEARIVVLSIIVMILCGAGMLAIVCFEIKSAVWVLIILIIFCGMQGSSLTAGFGLVMSARSGGAGAASGIFGVLCFLAGAVMSPLVGVMGENSLIPLGVLLFLNSLLSYILFKLGYQQHPPVRQISL